MRKASGANQIEMDQPLEKQMVTFRYRAEVSEETPGDGRWMDNLAYHDGMTSPGFQVEPAFFNVRPCLVCQGMYCFLYVRVVGGKDIAL